MSARTKLNAAYVLGSLVVAALFGGLFQSWTAFILAAVLLIGVCLSDGAIRPRGRRR